MSRWVCSWPTPLPWTWPPSWRVHMSRWGCSWPTPLPWSWAPSWRVHMSRWGLQLAYPTHGHGHLHRGFTCPGGVVVVPLHFHGQIRQNRVFSLSLKRILVHLFRAILAPPSGKTKLRGLFSLSFLDHFDWLKLVEPFWGKLKSGKGQRRAVWAAGLNQPGQPKGSQKMPELAGDKKKVINKSFSKDHFQIFVSAKVDP